MRHSPLGETAYALMRLIAGLLLSCHGAQKLFGAFGELSDGSPRMLLAGSIEFFGGLLIAVGLFAGIAAFFASGLMATAYFTVHAPKGFWPIENKGELAVVYCFVFLAIAAIGSGVYSMDAIRKRGATPSPRLHTTPRLEQL